MTNENVLRRIEEAKASGTNELYLGGMGLTTLPTEIFQLTNLTELDLRHNQLRSLPPEICKLTNLQKLNLWNNRLNDQYSAICQLPNLRVLDLRNNQFKSLPPEICKLKNLKELNLYGNYIVRLPQGIDQLTKLTWLNLGHNHFSTLPPEIGRLTNLTKLDLRHSQFSGLPSAICKLTKLKELNLSNNELDTLPSEICQLTNLQRLFLLDNKLTTLPPQICQLRKLVLLNLSNNHLSSLPPEICKLTKLEELYFGRNPLRDPPYEIATRGIDAICQYFSSFNPTTSIGLVSNPVLLQPKNQPLNEVKILLVGDGAAGKTSLVKRLLHLPFDKHEDTTHGINIKGWQQNIGGREIKINVWDFGGQVIQHTTHQFFLSKRSLYILVLDGRKDERPEYWLQHIESFGGDSPVLVVLNKQDENYGFDLNRRNLQRKYPVVRGFYPISCKEESGIEEFRTALLKELPQVPLLDTLWSKSWFQVKEWLEQMREPYITCDEYESYCKEIGIAERQAQEVLIEYLNDLGVAVHFKELELDDTHVLNPLWLTKGVYRLVTAQKVARQGGVLQKNDLCDLLRRESTEDYDYPRSRHKYLLALMQKFELCYKLDSQRELIPTLLPVPEPEFSFDESASLRFALHYPHFLPPSVFPRFIVKVHKDIHANTCWRTGVLLRDKRSGAQALIKADVEERWINIQVQGETPREYLHYLRYLFIDINSSFEKLTVSERVPMPDDPQKTADYETLLKYRNQGIERYIPEGSDQVYKVDELLGLVQPKDKDELARVAEKASPQDTKTWRKTLTEMIEPTWTVPGLGITFNLNGFLKKLLEQLKQKRQQGR